MSEQKAEAEEKNEEENGKAKEVEAEKEKVVLSPTSVVDPFEKPLFGRCTERHYDRLMVITKAPTPVHLTV